MESRNYWLKPIEAHRPSYQRKEGDFKAKEKNSFSLFYPNARAKEGEKEFKKLWEKFSKDWMKLQVKYSKEGATDSMSREYQISWIQKKAEHDL